MKVLGLVKIKHLKEIVSVATAGGLFLVFIVLTMGQSFCLQKNHAQYLVFYSGLNE